MFRLRFVLRFDTVLQSSGQKRNVYFLLTATVCNWWPLPTHKRSVVYVRTSRKHKVLLVCMVDGRGYNRQQKSTICDTCRPCHSILSVLKPASCQIRWNHCAYVSLRRLNIKIWQFFCGKWRQRNWFILPLAQECGVKMNIRWGEKERGINGVEEKKTTKCQPQGRFELPTPGLQDQCSNPWATEAWHTHNCQLTHISLEFGNEMLDKGVVKVFTT